MDLNIRKHFLTFFFGLVLSMPVLAETFLYEWYAHPGADVYVVTVFRADSTHRIMTRRPRIILEEETKLSVQSFSHQRGFLSKHAYTIRTAKPSPLRVVSSNKKHVLYTWKKREGSSFYRGEVVQGEKSYSFLTRHSQAILPSHTSVDIESTDETGYREAVSGVRGTVILPLAKQTKKPDPEREPTAEEREIEALREESRKAFDVARFRILSAGLFFGSEDISISGGTSELEASSKIGGGELSLSILLDSPEKKLWTLDFHTMMHVFRSLQSEEAGGVVSSNSKVSRFSRHNTGLTANRYWDISSNMSFRFGLGLGAVGLPIAAAGEERQGQLNFESSQVLGLSFALGYIWQFIRQQDIFVDFDLLALGFGTIKPDGMYKIGIGTRYHFSDTLHSEAKILSRTEGIKGEIVCPVDSTDCNETFKSSSSILTLNIGLGYFF